MMWEVEYMQYPRGNTWVHKFDHVPRDDGRWHRISGRLKGVYRVEGDVFQLCKPRAEITDSEWEGLLGQIKDAGPLGVAGVVEVCLARRAEGYWLWPLEGAEDEGVALDSLSAAALSTACGEALGGAR